MSTNLAALGYLIAAVCFILALRGLSSPATSRAGNRNGMIGMTIAILVSLLLLPHPSALAYLLILVAIVIGGGIGYTVAQRIEMTAMPQLVAAFHSLVGLAAVFVAVGAFLSPSDFGITDPDGSIHHLSRFEMGLGIVIGAITFSGSVIAFGKLQAKLPAGRRERAGPAQARRAGGDELAADHAARAGTSSMPASARLIVLLLLWFIATPEPAAPSSLMTLLAFAIGFLLIIPIGGADMPVVVSMLNSYSGWAAAGIGFTLKNPMLIVTGALVGSSGAILSYIMCRAMNRSFISVILGGFGETGGAAAADDLRQDLQVGLGRRRGVHDGERAEGDHRAGLRHGGVAGAACGARALRDPDQEGRRRAVRDPPGGRPHARAHERAAGRGQHPLRRRARDGGHQQRVPQADVAYVIGANDITNPAAKTDSSSPIFGMPVLDVDRAKAVFFIKRSTAPGYAGIDNPLFYMDRTMMLFGDAKKMTEEIVKAIQ